MKIQVTKSAAIASSILLIGHVCGGKFSDYSHRKQQRVEAALNKHQIRENESNSTSSFRYLTEQTEAYRVTSLPSVPFDVGELYSGLVPVYDDPSRALFFFFAPTTSDPVDEVTIWLNGGPGCSSLEGFIQENVRMKRALLSIHFDIANMMVELCRGHSFGSQALTSLCKTHIPGQILPTCSG